MPKCARAINNFPCSSKKKKLNLERTRWAPAASVVNWYESAAPTSDGWHVTLCRYKTDLDRHAQWTLNCLSQNLFSQRCYLPAAGNVQQDSRFRSYTLHDHKNERVSLPFLACTCRRCSCMRQLSSVRAVCCCGFACRQLCRGWVPKSFFACRSANLYRIV